MWPNDLFELEQEFFAGARRFRWRLLWPPRRLIKVLLAFVRLELAISRPYQELIVSLELGHPTR